MLMKSCLHFRHEAALGSSAASHRGRAVPPAQRRRLLQTVITCCLTSLAFHLLIPDKSSLLCCVSPGSVEDPPAKPRWAGEGVRLAPLSAQRRSSSGEAHPSWGRAPQMLAHGEGCRAGCPPALRRSGLLLAPHRAPSGTSSLSACLV